MKSPLLHLSVGDDHIRPNSAMIEQKNELFWLRLTEDHLTPAHVIPFLVGPDSGGIDLFLGTTRQFTQGKETLQLFYEAYETMALAEMERLVEQARSQWPINRAVVWHRLGLVPLAEASVIIGIASAHRDAAFEASRYLIDTLKIQVPIWKKEHFADGTKQWIQGKELPKV